MPHSITEEQQKVAWVCVNPKSTPPKDTEKQKQTILFSGGLFGESHQVTGRGEGSGKGYKEHKQ